MRRHSPARRATVLAGAAALSLVLAACGGEDGAAESEDGPDTVTFSADNGEIEIPADPERVVATGYAVPVLLEVDAPLVGISEWGRGTALMTEEDLATYEETPKVMGESADSINYDAVAAAEPDVIILGVPLPVLGDVNMERLETIAPVVVLGPGRPDDWKDLGARQSEAAGASEQYAENQEAYEARAAELTDKYADVLEGLDFGHVGSYGDVTAGQFHREFAGSWGTNIATDIGVTYYGEVKDPTDGGSAEVSEYPSIEELPDSLGDADVITYSVQGDGTPVEAVQYVLDSPLWKNLPAVEDGMAVGVRHTEAATYASAMQTLDALDAAFEEAFAEELE
ncbi:ABC transporter substrate-binding protein [Nocardioides sp. zg-1228]|uniref:ABC transporter substrate-binding protein n=1 Tax=Nocardioides sp. zg-1228 TaxID=2763008 RepID=UPI0016430A0F|nr:ABC transporter substrate-binding protein [Nocardioides sp. zg-1228]MBC2931590.1 ABC transporter substrate-binding protein [Nocardioides sp. zg-1228]QSF57187.1 ABC transporter substrate-binding protein [Nocardioides sp. zg-1228]